MMCTPPSCSVVSMLSLMHTYVASNLVAMHWLCLYSPYSMDVTTIPQGTGSGFIWDDKGHVVTNYHVVKDANALRVTLFDSTSCSATIVGADENKDIAVLKLELPERQAAALRKVMVGRSTGLAVGQKVFAIGNPFGLDHTLTAVRLSGYVVSLCLFIGIACDHIEDVATCRSAHKFVLRMNGIFASVP